MHKGKLVVFLSVGVVLVASGTQDAETTKLKKLVRVKRDPLIIPETLLAALLGMGAAAFKATIIRTNQQKLQGLLDWVNGQWTSEDDQQTDPNIRYGSLPSSFPNPHGNIPQGPSNFPNYYNPHSFDPHDFHDGRSFFSPGKKEPRSSYNNVRRTDHPWFTMGSQTADDSQSSNETNIDDPMKRGAEYLTNPYTGDYLSRPDNPFAINYPPHYPKTRDGQSPCCNPLNSGPLSCCPRGVTFGLYGVNNIPNPIPWLLCCKSARGLYASDYAYYGPNDGTPNKWAFIKAYYRNYFSKFRGADTPSSYSGPNDGIPNSYNLLQNYYRNPVTRLQGAAS